MSPRLHHLMAKAPELCVQLEVTDAPVYFVYVHVDLALRYCNGQCPYTSDERIMNKTVSVVCPQEYCERKVIS